MRIIAETIKWDQNAKNEEINWLRKRISLLRCCVSYHRKGRIDSHSFECNRAIADAKWANVWTSWKCQWKRNSATPGPMMADRRRRCSIPRSVTLYRSEQMHFALPDDKTHKPGTELHCTGSTLHNSMDAWQWTDWIDSMDSAQGSDSMGEYCVDWLGILSMDSMDTAGQMDWSPLALDFVEKVAMDCGKCWWADCRRWVRNSVVFSERLDCAAELF